MDLSIIIPSFNTKDLTVACVKSIIKNTKGVKFEIIIVDNASTDDSVKAIESLGQANLTVIKNKENTGFAAANNLGTKQARGNFLLYLNSDTLIQSDLLEQMTLWLENNPKAGIATCALKNKDGSLQSTGGHFPNLLNVFSWMTIQDFPFVDSFIKPFHPLHAKSFFFRGEGFYKQERKMDWVTGAFLLTKKSIIESVEGWDESYFMYMEEVDLCFRIKSLGYEVWYLPKWNIIHLGGASTTISGYSILSEFDGVKHFFKKFYPDWEYPLLRLLLKIGALGRVVLFGILNGREAAGIYVNAFKKA